uniref:Uncharacterized protein n=1 Tax=Panagrolaimus sp. PS1159 TaxID=55785 RepID=A0AC35F451_9BILA
MGICACWGFEGLPHHIFTYPLNVQSIFKVIIQLLIIVSFNYWNNLRPFLRDFNAFLIVAIFISLILLSNSISIVFIVQKYYWFKCILIVLMLILNIFCTYWAIFQTQNSVSNRYISNWGESVAEIELNAFGNDFDNAEGFLV